MTHSFTRCGCFQVRINSHKMRLWWQCTAPRHWIFLSSVWWIPSGLKIWMYSRKWHSGWWKLDTLGYKTVVRLETYAWNTTCADPSGECTPCWSSMDWRRACCTDVPCWKNHFTRCFRTVEGPYRAAGIALFGIVPIRSLEQRFWTMVEWMATRYLGGFCDLPIHQRQCEPNECKCSCAVFWTWQRRSIKLGTPTWNSHSIKSNTSCTRFSKKVLWYPLPG
jgi:hypothetical protein